MAEREPFRDMIARVAREQGAFIAMVKAEVSRSGAFIRPLREGRESLKRTGSYRGFATITRSTREGVAWQVTFWEGDPRGADAVPTGHLDVTGGVEDAAMHVIGMVERSPG
jgi:hypothetical protein